MAYPQKSYYGTKMSICRICHIEFKQKVKGRYREYCSDDCRNYFKYLSALDRTLSEITFFDKKSIKAIKSDLFGLVNALPKEPKNEL